MKKTISLAFAVTATALTALASSNEIAITPIGESQVSLVQPAPAYNSWPMIQAFDGKVLCAYSRGSAHTINEGRRGVFARTSSDNGKTWSTEVCVANDPAVGEVTIGKGLDENGAALVWIRRWGSSKGHDLYRTKDGSAFEKISAPKFDPMPMQVTDICHIPGKGLMSLWFAGNYANKESGHSWGTLTSSDNGLTWTQRTIEKDLPKNEWPTEQCMVHLGNGRILAIARSEGAARQQFQLTSTDGGSTWKRLKTNISDVRESTPTLFFDSQSGTVFNYYYQRGAKKLKLRTANADFIFTHPDQWPEPQELAQGHEGRAWDAGNVNGTASSGRHLLALYTGTTSDSAVFVVSVKPPVK